MKKQKKLKGAEALGIKVIRDKSLDKYSKVVLFPKNWSRLIGWLII